MSTSPEEPHPLDSVAALATILNNIVAFSVRAALLKVHNLFADDAAEKIDQRALIVIQVASLAASASGHLLNGPSWRFFLLLSSTGLAYRRCQLDQVNGSHQSELSAA